MAKLTPEEYAEKQARNLKNSLPDIRSGIQRVSAAPGQAAAAAQQRMKDNLNRSIDDGRWAAKVSAVSLEDWKQAALTKGVDRIASGIDAAHSKQVQMAGRLLSAVDSSAAKVKNMPRGTIQDSIARMSAFVEDMHKFKGKI
tara:strand:- start:166 stop:591 length:426 start_codon:yes stop_codon:yes gene_type:complete